MQQVSFPTLGSHGSTKLETVITIPILMLCNVRISWKKKFALMGIFSLTVIVIVFSIVRVVLIYSENRTADVSWLYMWYNIEVAICKFISLCTNLRIALTDGWAVLQPSWSLALLLSASYLLGRNIPVSYLSGAGLFFLSLYRLK